MSAAGVETFVSYVKHQRIWVDHAHIAAGAIMVYDYLLTIHLEIKFIWLSPWSYLKALFFIARYLPLISLGFMLHIQVMLDVSKDSCEGTYPVDTWLLAIGILCSETILSIRTWAVWGRNRIIGLVLVVSNLVACAVGCVSLVQFTKSLQFSPVPYVGFRGCFVSHTSQVLFVNFLMLTILESLVLGLMVTSAIKAYHLRHTNELLNIVHTNGIMFCVFLLIVTILNLVVILTLPADLRVLFPPLQNFLYSVLTSRIIINIRALADKVSEDSELHHGYPDLTNVVIDSEVCSFEVGSHEVGNLPTGFSSLV